MPDRFLQDTAAGETPTSDQIQQLVESEHGRGTQGINRRWLASNSALPVLTSDASGVKISRDGGSTAPQQVIVDGTPAGGALTGTYPNPTLGPATVNGLIPPGTIWAYAQNSAPAGWALCAGQAVSRAGNPILFGLISTQYGAGDGSTTFNLPNLAGRVILMVSGSHPLATPGGFETAPGPLHTHPGEHSHGMNAHTHTQTTHTHTPGSHTHTQTTHTHTPGSHTHTIDHQHTNAHTHATDLAHGHGAVGGATGATGEFNVVTPGFRTAVDTHGHTVTALGTTSTTSSASSNGTTSGTLTLSNTPSANDTGGASAASTGTPSANDTGGASAASTGTPSNPNTEPTNSQPAAAYGGVTIPTLPPFLTLCYIIRLG